MNKVDKYTKEEEREIEREKKQVTDHDRVFEYMLISSGTNECLILCSIDFNLNVDPKQNMLMNVIFAYFSHRNNIIIIIVNVIIVGCHFNFEKAIFRAMTCSIMYSEQICKKRIMIINLF